MSSEVTARKHPGLAPPWKPGQSGNPLGRPKGARSKFSEAFLDDFYADWQAHGAEVIKRVRDEHPDVYLKVAASILPKEVDIKPTEFNQFTDAELESFICEEFQALVDKGYVFPVRRMTSANSGDASCPTAAHSVTKSRLRVAR